MCVYIYIQYTHTKRHAYNRNVEGNRVITIDETCRRGQKNQFFFGKTAVDLHVIRTRTHNARTHARTHTSRFFYQCFSSRDGLLRENARQLFDEQTTDRERLHSTAAGSGIGFVLILLLIAPSGAASRSSTHIYLFARPHQGINRRLVTSPFHPLFPLAEASPSRYRGNRLNVVSRLPPRQALLAPPLRLRQRTSPPCPAAIRDRRRPTERATQARLAFYRKKILGVHSRIYTCPRVCVAYIHAFLPLPFPRRPTSSDAPSFLFFLFLLFFFPFCFIPFISSFHLSFPRIRSRRMTRRRALCTTPFGGESLHPFFPTGVVGLIANDVYVIGTN